MHCYERLSQESREGMRFWGTTYPSLPSSIFNIFLPKTKYFVRGGVGEQICRIFYWSGMSYSPWRLYTYPWHFHSKDGQQQDARSDASMCLTWRSEKLVATSKRKMKYFYKRPGNRWINPTSQEWPTSIFSKQNQYIIKGTGYENWLSDRAISVWPWKMVSISVRYLFSLFYGWKDQNITSSFSRQRKP